MTDETVEETAQDRRTKLMRKAYVDATKLLRNKYKDEFIQMQQQAAKALGLTDWTPRPSKATRARKQVEKLLAENPALREELLEAARRDIS